ncbi:MAG: histidine phosphatase family protein [Clostridia bacterium]|nr:histidine phosphatase family protein [Clostridia bacterium]
MNIIFIRHADPDYENDSLTEKGIKEAELLRERIKKMDADEYYCSPLGRAKKTCETAMEFTGKKAVILDWLREFPGEIVDPVTGKNRIPWDLMPSYWTNFNDLYDKEKWINTPIMKSGSAHTLYRDVCRKFDEFLALHGYERNNNVYKAVTPNKDTIVLFCHFGIECVLLSHILGISPLVLWQSFIALPTSITVIKTEEREEGIAYFRCRAFGDTAHLYKENTTPSESGAFCEVFKDKDDRD